ncbi:MAG: hypothetical protein COA78_10080 [Blastopirellula sp.]|nr:MAG: hypothetical protein COA78_10080 [Blastopirellula sp.]
MRQIGKIERPERAVRFVDYLLTQGISAKTEEHNDQWTIWIHDENQIDQAKSELDDFRLDPDHSRYTEAKHEATAIRKVEHKENEQRRKNIINMRGKFKNPGMGGAGGVSSLGPVTKTLMIISVVVTLSGIFFYATKENRPSIGYWVYDYAGFVSNSDRDAATVGKDPLVTIKKGEIWRFVTPIFPHDPNGIFHILFNMIWLYILGGRLENYLGSRNFLMLCLFMALGSNLAEAFGQVLVFGQYHGFYGMSGVVYGLFGFMWMKTLYDPNPLTFLPPRTIFIMVVWFLICWAGVMGGVANYAHTGGLAVGVVAGIWGKLMQK